MSTWISSGHKELAWLPAAARPRTRHPGLFCATGGWSGLLVPIKDFGMDFKGAVGSYINSKPLERMGP